MRGSLSAKVIHDPGEAPLEVYSEVREPLASLSFLRRSLALAELAMIAYNGRQEAQRAAAAIGFPQARLIDRNGAQAFHFRNQYDVVLTCRGTQTNEWSDVKANAYAVMAVIGTLGRVHSGFNREVKSLWPSLHDLLRGESKPVWFCGHSLGAAMATICAYRCKSSPDVANPRELHTFGSPRIGCKRYVRHAPLNHYRWFHNNDIVTRVPPVMMGYRHGGSEIYFDRRGRIRKPTSAWRSRDRWRGFVRGLWKWRLDLLSDHGIQRYVENLVRAVEQEEAALAMNRAPAFADELALVVEHGLRRSAA